MKIKPCSAYPASLVFLFACGSVQVGRNVQAGRNRLQTMGHEFLTIAPSGINLPFVRSVGI